MCNAIWKSFLFINILLDCNYTKNCEFRIVVFVVRIEIILILNEKMFHFD